MATTSAHTKSSGKKPGHVSARKSDKAWILVCAAALAYAVALLWYSATFGSRISDSQAIWGQFGDFIGGAVNPLIGLATAVLLYLAYQVQRRELRLSQKELKKSAAALSRQIKHLEKRSILDDLNRCIEGAYHQWEAVGRIYYRGNIGIQGGQSVQADNSQNNLVSRFDALLTDPYAIQMSAALSHGAVANFRTDWQRNFRQFINLAREAADYLDEYDRIHGPAALTDYYRRRIHPAAARLSTLGLLDLGIVRRLVARPATADDSGAIRDSLT